MRLVALVSVSFTAVVAACSSSSTEDVLPADAGSDTSSSSDFDAGSSPDVSTTFEASTFETSVADTGPQHDAGAPVVLDGGAEFEGGVPCVQGGILEIEPNDSAGTATPFTTSICGAVLPGGDAGDAATESDFATFTLQSATSSFYVEFAGDVSLVITVDNQTVTLTPTSFPSIPFVKGKPYIVEVKANQPQRTFWRVSLFES
jgi:hypothetical protein